MKPKLYVETTIVGYLVGRTSRDLITAWHQEITIKWWKERRQAFELYCSELVIDEAAKGDRAYARQRSAILATMPVLETSSEARGLTNLLIKRKAIPLKAVFDATHLAIAAVNGMNYLLTWNCSHLANASLRALIERVCDKAGYRCPVICTPEELLEE